MKFSDRLKELREEKGLTQKEFATLLNINRATVAGYESQGKEPNFDRLKEYLFDSNTYKYPGILTANNNSRSIIKYLEVYGMDVNSVKCINNLINIFNYGSFIESIHNYLKKDDYWEKYRNIINENDMTDYSAKLEKKS